MAKSSTSGQGRPKGVPNKFPSDLKKMVFGALEQGGGQKWLYQQMSENPVAFMTLLGKFVPRDVALSGDVNHVISVTQASDDELLKIINGG